jgi:hypothetical protein
LLKGRLADLGVRPAVSLLLGGSRGLFVNPHDPALRSIRLAGGLGSDRTACGLSVDTIDKLELLNPAL